MYLLLYIHASPFSSLLSLSLSLLSLPLSPFAQFPDSQRSLFESHKLACEHLVEALLIIFIDIEFTGDSMEFEAKFGKPTSNVNTSQSFCVCI